MTINQLLKQLRLQHQISQQNLANQLGFAHRSNISRLENGILDWQFEKVEKFAEIIGISLSNLIKEYERINKNEQKENAKDKKTIFGAME